VAQDFDTTDFHVEAIGTQAVWEPHLARRMSVPERRWQNGGGPRDVIGSGAILSCFFGHKKYGCLMLGGVDWGAFSPIRQIKQFWGQKARPFPSTLSLIAWKLLICWNVRIHLEEWSYKC
jgi:hypothetical protein